MRQAPAFELIIVRLLNISTHRLVDASSMMLMKNDRASLIVRQTIANNIRSLRIESGHNQAKFAEMINVNRSYINQIELGKENVSIDILVKIADGLDQPIAAFFRGLETQPPRKLTHATVDYYSASLPPAD